MVSKHVWYCKLNSNKDRPYGGPDPEEVFPRYTQGLCFARDTRSGSEDSNHYGYPLPIIPVMDTYKSEIVRVDRLATGGKEDGLAYGTHPRNVLDHCGSAEYVPELLEMPLRSDLKPLNVVQPDGPSFSVDNDSLVEWQKWRFRVGFNPREGATLHDIHYDGRSIMYRLSLSEMTVPYGDPRPPFHRKQAFDFGDGGAGRAANNLALGCDCLGVIKYFDSVIADSEGKPSVSKNVVCLHEQDGGIGWKHTNFRTGRAVVTRSRELVVQFIITLANYEYVFAYKFDQAGGMAIETRATGIVSVVNIDKGKTSPWGNIVSPGALAQNHQHIFAIRMDPAIDGHRNTIFSEESLPIPMNPQTNPWGNGYQVVSTPITTSSYLDASPFTNRTIKMSNPHITNPISGKPVSYKFIPSATQLMLADKNSIAAKRAAFAQHHVWVTKYVDGELWAGGEFTNQSQVEAAGVADAVARKDHVEDTDVVVWSVFGLTHNPRVEDWPVMPVEKHELHIRPADFFNFNPALDVPGNKNLSSVQVDGDEKTCCSEKSTSGAVQEAPTSHFQGTGTIRPKGDSRL
jgi:primary-amine oxidase